MTRRGWLWVGVVLVALGAGPSWGQGTAAAWPEVLAEVSALREAGALDEAVGVVDQFLARHTALDPISAEAVSFIDQTMWRVGGGEAKLPFGQRAAAQTANVFYHVWGQHIVARHELEQRQRPNEALRRVEGVMAEVGARLPEWWYFTVALHADRLEALGALDRAGEALAAAGEVIERYPRVLTNFDFLRTLTHLARQVGDGEQERAALAQWYALGDFNEAALREQTERIEEALMRLAGPGEALAFAKSQEDPAVANPLRAAPRFAGGDPAAVQAALGDPLPDEQRYPQFIVYLWARQWPAALAFCREEMARAAGNLEWQANAVAWVARLFKAHDLSVLRANQWLDYQRSGEGVNPLPALAAELAAAAGAEEAQP